MISVYVWYCDIRSYYMNCKWIDLQCMIEFQFQREIQQIHSAKDEPIIQIAERIYSNEISEIIGYCKWFGWNWSQGFPNICLNKAGTFSEYRMNLDSGEWRKCPVLIINKCQ